MPLPSGDLNHGKVLYGYEANERRNEPEGQCKKDLTVGIKCDLDSFLKYWDATIAGIRSVSDSMFCCVNLSVNGAKDLIFGGTASDGDHSFLFATIEHCLHGKNYITGQDGITQPPPCQSPMHTQAVAG